MLGLKWFKKLAFYIALLTFTLQSSPLYTFDIVNRSLLYQSTRYLVGFVCQVDSSAVNYTLSFVKKNNRYVSWQNLRTDERAFLDREMLSTCTQIFTSRITNPLRSIFYSLQLQQNQTTCSSSSLNSTSLGFLRTILAGAYVCSEGGSIQLSEGLNSKLCISGQGLRRVCTVTFPVLGNFSFNVLGGQEEEPTPNPRSQLSRFSGEFNRLAAARLLSKIGLGATRLELDQAIQLGLDNFVNKLVDDCNLNIPTSRARQLEPIARNIRKSLAAPHRTSRESVNYYEKPDQLGNFAGYERDTISSLNNYLYFHFLNGSPVCASMWVILHNWFALQHDALSIDQYPALTGDYVDLIFKNLVGSFEELLKGMHSNAHMLVWLDNHLNRVKCAANGNPTTGVNCFTANQNYAREVMELFTIGTNDIFRPRSDGGIDQGAVNYTELDVEHLTRAAVGPERVVLPENFSREGIYPGPAKRNHNDTSFCSYRRINIQRGRDTLIDIYPLGKYSSSCINITGLRESRFGFNYSNWVFGETSREFDPLNREFYRGVYLFAGTPWAVGSPNHRVQLNLNTFKCRNYGDQNQNTELPCQFSFNHRQVTSVPYIPRDATFQTGDEVITDNLTQILLYHHGYFPGKGSSAARKLAIQLLGYFIGHRAANTPSLVYELAETLVQNRFDLGATLKVLLKSEAIFSDEHHKTVFKTPFEWSLKIARVLRLPQMYYYTNGGHTYFTSIRWIDEISRQTGFPNLDLPSVFGVPVAGIQRNTMSSDGRGFAGPVQYLLRGRLLNFLQRYLFVHYTRGAAPRMDPSSSDSVLGSYTIQEGPENVLVYRTQPDPWGWNGSANPDIRYLIYGHQYPQFFGFDITENQRRYAPYSGQMFNWLDYLRENAVLSSVTSAQIDPNELIDELALMFGVSLTSQQKQELLNFFTRLKPQDANSCWGNLRDILAQDGLRSTMSRTEAEKRYFSLKFWGLVYALALNSADSWTK